MQDDSRSSAPPPADDAESPTRRRFLSLATVAVGAAAGGAIGLPLVSAVVAPVGQRTVRPAAGFLDVGALDELRVGQPRRVSVRAPATDGWQTSEEELGAAWIVRHEDGTLSAFSAACPHLGCAVDLAENKAVPFACPCHDSAFTLGGECRGGPSPRGLDSLKVTTENGRILLRFQRFVPGLASKVEV